MDCVRENDMHDCLTVTVLATYLSILCAIFLIAYMQLINYDLLQQPPAGLHIAYPLPACVRVLLICILLNGSLLLLAQRPIACCLAKPHARNLLTFDPTLP